MVAPPNTRSVLRTTPIAELLDFLLWIDYIKSGNAPGMPAWHLVDKQEIVVMLVDKMQAATSYLAHEVELAADNDTLAMQADGLRLLLQCRHLLTELRVAS